MTFNEIQELIRLVSKQKISELVYKEGEMEITIRNQTTQVIETVPVMAPVAAPVAYPQAVNAPPAAPAASESAPSADKPAPAPAADDSARYLSIKSPMVGTFYRSPSPDKPPFIKVGDAIDAGQPVCIIEAMKLFNEIESDVKGKIVKVMVEDASPVEYDQVLFLVDPA